MTVSTMLHSAHNVYCFAAILHHISYFEFLFYFFFVCLHPVLLIYVHLNYCSIDGFKCCFHVRLYLFQHGMKKPHMKTALCNTIKIFCHQAHVLFRNLCVQKFAPVVLWWFSSLVALEFQVGFQLLFITLIIWSSLSYSRGGPMKLIKVNLLIHTKWM